MCDGAMGQFIFSKYSRNDAGFVSSNLSQYRVGPSKWMVVVSFSTNPPEDSTTISPPRRFAILYRNALVKAGITCELVPTVSV